jgi:hypothetical protein
LLAADLLSLAALAFFSFFVAFYATIYGAQFMEIPYRASSQ